jgi:hypothetical protein
VIGVVSVQHFHMVKESASVAEESAANVAERHRMVEQLKTEDKITFPLLQQSLKIFVSIAREN